MLSVFALPAIGSAQPEDSSAPSAPVPSYARPPAHSDEETVRGRIASLNGKYDLVVNDDRGYIDNVRMHQGTIINPTGIGLRPGMSVTILGYNRGQVFEANQIDTPYSQVEFGPPYPYPYPPYVYGPYPYYPGGFILAPRFGFRWH
jgi:hypothetical protein